MQDYIDLKEERGEHPLAVCTHIIRAASPHSTRNNPPSRMCVALIVLNSDDVSLCPLATATATDSFSYRNNICVNTRPSSTLSTMKISASVPHLEIILV